MGEFELFTAALGLGFPWQVMGVDFDEAKARLDLVVDFAKGTKFACPECEQAGCPVHDTVIKTWRHLDFFQHQAYLSARVPRVKCVYHGVVLIDVPWARQGSGFTLLFEALVIQFARVMAISKVAAMVKEHDTRIWRIVEHYVNLLRENQDYSQVKTLGADETSARKGHDYVSIFMDLERAKVLYATEGKDASTVERFVTDLENHDGSMTNIEKISIDMSRAFISGVQQFLPCADITFDRFHVVKKLSEAVDMVRRAEQKNAPELKNSRYVWLKNQENLTTKQQEKLTWLTRPSMRLAAARAYQWMQDFQGFYTQKTPEAATAYLKQWCYGAKRSRLQPIKDFVKLIEAHYDGIISWHTSHISNGLLEGTNSLIQAAKARARGYKNPQKMITIIYLIAAKLPLPTLQQPLTPTHTK